jgi:hypothetical protein
VSLLFETPVNLDAHLCAFSPADGFTIRQACAGVHIFGGNGSGKTSGSGATLARAYLRAGFGGLVLTAKVDETQTWLRYARETGREQDVILFSSEQEKYRFNFLAYETRRQQRGGGLTDNIVKLFLTLVEARERSKSRGGDSDPFWQQALEQLLRNAIDLIQFAGRRHELSVLLIRKIVRSAPKILQDVDSDAWMQRSFCMQLLAEANARGLTPRDAQRLQLVGEYWLQEFPAMAADTRASVEAMFGAIADIFLHQPLDDLFGTTLTVVPEMTHAGRIWIVDLPVKEFGPAGRFAQIIVKLLWQQAAERRTAEPDLAPIFLWADEAQEFVNEHDIPFQDTARSARACTVFLSQTLSNYHAALGGNDHARALTASLLGVLQTKIFHANTDPDTNEWATRLFAKEWQYTATSSVSHSDRSGATMTGGGSQTLQDMVQPGEFLTLRTGGPESGHQVQAIISQGGRRWNATQKPVLRTTFLQRSTR